MRFGYYILVAALICIGLKVSAQGDVEHHEFQHYTCPEHRTGCYLSFKDFNKNRPVISSGFELVKKHPQEKWDSRSGGYICKLNEKDYGSDSGISIKKIKAERIWGVYYDDTLYINRKFYIGKEGFDKVFCLGSQGYFHSINPNSEAGYENDVFNSSLLFGVAGGTIAETSAQNKESWYGQYPRIMIYLLDFETGMIAPLNSFKLEKILEDDSQLLDLYNKEKYRFSMMTMHLYIDTYTEKHKNMIIHK